jgi:hypothetical protein
MGRHVMVATVDGDEGSTILVTVCVDPTEAYASKNQKHVGFIREDAFLPDKGAQVSEPEVKAILLAHHFMVDALNDIHIYS